MVLRKTLTFFILAIGLAIALPVWAQEGPLTEAQVEALVNGGMGDDSGAKVIQRRGLDFVPAEVFLNTLKAEGATDAFLKALRTAKAPEPVAPKQPLNQVQILALLG